MFAAKISVIHVDRGVRADSIEPKMNDIEKKI